MKEIIYIQVGSLANHVGTHFWNAQQCYFSYEEGDEVLVDHDISFREGISPGGEATFCPRVLVLDRKANFGSLSKDSGLYGDETDGPGADPELWSGNVDELRQPSISTSVYQKHLDEEIVEDPADARGEAGAETRDGQLQAPILRASEVRYWSDFSRVYYLPRSLHQLPDALDFENSDEDWLEGKTAFERYDAEHSLIEDSFRLFVEECDAFQGISLTADTASFGPFSVAMLDTLRDEYPRTPILGFPILSGVSPGVAATGDLRKTRRALNDARLLHALAESDVTSVPLQNPSTWSCGSWPEDIHLYTDRIYETSAILSAHIESSTLPLRLKAESTGLLELCSKLNVYGNTPFAELSGVLPAVDSSAVLEQRRQNFTWFRDSGVVKTHSDVWLFRRDVIRGPRRADDAERSVMYSGTLPIASFAAPIEYPLPTSFPYFFNAPHLNKRSRRTPRGILTQPRTVPIVSSLGVRKDGLPKLLGRYASFVDDCARYKVDWQALGIEQDEARELGASIWTTVDNFGAISETSDELGEDEER
ncbi:unnamed protein product [Peniophora sp. CBMAI 1063]|nr:unnamed protein product [Peniophora sp. CBMAI 1063]